MKSIQLLMILCSLLATTTHVAANERQNSGQPFALVELFTSQGCSSCPPADAYLQDIMQTAREKNLRVFTLGFHVDYWDYLGWRDPFANRKYTDRQRRYAQVMRSDTIYTPQMIVNGVNGFGGFRRDQGRKAIESALNLKPKINLSITSARPDRDKLKVSYTAVGDSKDAVLNIALVERNISTDVRRGENAGRILTHDNSVRGFKSVKLNSSGGNVRLSLPGNLNFSKASVIGYVQDPRTMKVLGANILDLDSVTP